VVIIKSIVFLDVTPYNLIDRYQITRRQIVQNNILNKNLFISRDLISSVLNFRNGIFCAENLVTVTLNITIFSVIKV
jgi:RNase adaptor protein for sRNA GlmZ degradation